MATFTREVATDITIPNMTVYRLFRDGEHYAYEVYTNTGYVMYDTAADNKEPDENGNLVPVIYYYTNVGFPKSYDFDNFTWVAVPRDSVDENYIFGGDINPPEVDI